jgi:two-component system OmpR family response regulator
MEVRMMTKTILVVEDEVKIRELLDQHLTNEGYEVLQASNGAEAVEIVRNQPVDLVILDLMMPVMDGYATLRELRNINRRLPVIMLTAKTEEIDMLLGLELGADDYMTKPFSLRELTARIKSVLRRVCDEIESKDRFSQEQIVRGNLRILPEEYEAYIDGEKANLTPTEFKILMALARKPGRVFSRLQLMSVAMGEEYINYERSIDTHVSNLRKKIEEDPANPKHVLTVYGIGYRFGTEQ